MNLIEAHIARTLATLADAGMEFPRIALLRTAWDSSRPDWWAIGFHPSTELNLMVGPNLLELLATAVIGIHLVAVPDEPHAELEETLVALLDAQAAAVLAGKFAFTFAALGVMRVQRVWLVQGLVRHKNGRLALLQLPGQIDSSLNDVCNALMEYPDWVGNQ